MIKRNFIVIDRHLIDTRLETIENNNRGIQLSLFVQNLDRLANTVEEQLFYC